LSQGLFIVAIRVKWYRRHSQKKSFRPRKPRRASSN
jgi:hypothetical protein